MIDFIKEKRRKGYTKRKQRENTIGSLVHDIAIIPIITFLTLCLGRIYGWITTVLIMAILLVTIFPKLEDLIYYLLGKRGRQLINQEKLTTVRTFRFWVLFLANSFAIYLSWKLGK